MGDLKKISLNHLVTEPWSGGSAGWSIVLYTKRLQIRLQVRAQTLVSGSIPGLGMYGRQPIHVSLLHQCFSLSHQYNISPDED